jgi:hypothetical protein
MHLAYIRAALVSGITQGFEMHSETRMLPCTGEFSEDMLGGLAYMKVCVLERFAG